MELEPWCVNDEVGPYWYINWLSKCFFFWVCSPGGALLSLFLQENPLSNLVPSLNEVASDWLHMSSCTRKCPVPCLVLRAMQRIFFKNIMFTSVWKIVETFPKVRWHTCSKEQIEMLRTRTLTAWISSVENQPSIHPIVPFWESQSESVSNLLQSKNP